MIAILNLVLPFLEAFLAQHGQNLPADILESVTAAYNALVAHKADLMTKADWEAQRG
jgi:hypothetical protein